ncbi:MAG: hypothetical protein OXF52_04800 [Candidatus Dadabacteria bacterium]|nr:hypothetical protein [Candidatus Dadabacteria bacterium]
MKELRRAVQDYKAKTGIVFNLYNILSRDEFAKNNKNVSLAMERVRSYEHVKQILLDNSCFKEQDTKSLLQSLKNAENVHTDKVGEWREVARLDGKRFPDLSDYNKFVSMIENVEARISELASKNRDSQYHLRVVALICVFVLVVVFMIVTDWDFLRNILLLVAEDLGYG